MNLNNIEELLVALKRLWFSKKLFSLSLTGMSAAVGQGGYSVWADHITK